MKTSSLLLLHYDQPLPSLSLCYRPLLDHPKLALASSCTISFYPIQRTLQAFFYDSRIAGLEPCSTSAT
jgi:hypothetical protein